MAQFCASVSTNHLPRRLRYKNSNLSPRSQLSPSHLASQATRRPVSMPKTRDVQPGLSSGMGLATFEGEALAARGGSAARVAGDCLAAFFAAGFELEVFFFVAMLVALPRTV